jgi:hypothetical protein
MPIVNWTQLGQPFTRFNVTVSDPWMLALEMLQGATHLQITATGTWVMMDGLVAACGPNGLAGLPIQPDRLIIADCPLGALIGKFGGSAATLSSASATGSSAPALAEGRAFGIGTYCVTKIPDGFIGPLLLGFNSLVRPVRVTDLTVGIAGATPTL